MSLSHEGHGQAAPGTAACARPHAIPVAVNNENRLSTSAYRGSAEFSLEKGTIANIPVLLISTHTQEQRIELVQQLQRSLLGGQLLCGCSLQWATAAAAAALSPLARLRL